jgi:enoyl-CoA hydratase/carnithine racemase
MDFPGERVRRLSDHLGIVFEEKDRAGVITLNRPSRLNALTREMFDALSEHYRSWAANPHIYGVVMQSAHPTVFCSGGDLKVLNEGLRKAPPTRSGTFTALPIPMSGCSRNSSGQTCR